MTRLALVVLALFVAGDVTVHVQQAIVPFKIHVPDEVLRDLKERLARTRFPDEIEGSGWEYGADLRYMKELVAYWRDKFDWRKQERALNAFDQYTIFDTSTPDVLPNVAPFAGSGGFINAGEYVNGVVYILENNNALYDVDPATGAILDTRTTNAPSGGETGSQCRPARAARALPPRRRAAGLWC